MATTMPNVLLRRREYTRTALFDDAYDGRYGVYRKQYVGRTYHQKHEEYHSDVQLTVYTGKKVTRLGIGGTNRRSCR